MKQVQHMMSRWIKGFVTTASMFVFSVSLASGNDITTTAPNTSTPYSYSDPNSTAPSYNNVGRPVDEETQSLMLNNQALGLGAIPVTVSTGYSANYGYELNASFAHNIGFYDAVSLLGAYAPQENRVDITWAHAWTEKQRTKLSIERLEEAMDFDYDSGSVTEWVPQYSYGAGYQYLFNKNWLKNVELTGYYAKAQSQDLSTIRFTGTDGNIYDNYRHIAGATSKGSEATLNVSPWKTGLVGLGLNYDSVNYDTKYDDTDAENASGLGFTLSLEQLLSKHVKLDLEGSQREVYDDYVAGVSFLTPSNLEVGVNGERTLGENGSASDSRFNLNLAYFLDDKNRYENGYSLEDSSQSDLASWASKSVAYMDEVLAAADQKTVQVITPPESNNPMLQSGDTTPEITLNVGEVNHVDISTYIAGANLTDAQKQTAPIIKGGPSDVEFTYDNATQTLVTKAEVPESVVNKTFEPLVLIFSTDTASERVLTKEALRDVLTDSLTFKVTVGATAPTLNPSFSPFDSSQPAPVVGHAGTWVFKYQNHNNTTDPLAMFINTNSSKSALYMSSGYPMIINDTNKCYSATTKAQSDPTETLTITGISSSVCPGNATVQVMTTNTAVSSPIQTITFSAAPAGTPVITPDTITDPTILEGQTYAPGHTFTTAEVDIGQNETFKTSTADTYVKVFDAGTNGTGCTDVTSSANWGLGFTNGDTQAILQSGSVVPESLTGHQLKIYLKITNNSSDPAHNSATNFGSSETNCSGTPFTATVQGAPHIPDNIPLGSMTVDTSYTYDFMTDGGSTYNVNNGSSAITGVSGSTITVKNSDGTEVISGLDLSDSLGLQLAQQGTDIVLKGIINPGYAGDTVYVTLNLTNQYGTSTNSAAPAFSEAITVNANQQPTVGSGAIANANVTQTYPGATLTGTTAGTGLSYVNLNPTTDINDGTYVKVANSTGADVTADAHVILSANGEVLSLQSDGTAVSNTLPSGNYNVYVHVTNNAPVSQSNCSDTDCSTLTGGTPYTMVVNTPSTLTGNVAIGPVDVGAPYNYDFVTAGTLTLGSSSLVPASSSVVITLAGDATNTPLTDTGITNTITASDVVLGGAPAAKYGNETLNVTLNLVDAAGLVVTNAQPEKLQITVPSTQASVVGTGAMPAVTVGSAYTSSTLTGTDSGAGRSYADVNTVSDTGTYVKVADASGKDVTNQMNVNLSANGEVLNLQSNGGVVDSSLTGSYNVYVHVMNDANSASSNCADVTCSTLTGGTPYTVFVNTPSTLTGDVAIGPVDINAPYTYDFVSAGTLTVGNNPLVPASSSVVITLAGDATNTPLTDTGITNTITASDVVLGGSPAAKYGNETLNVTLNLVDAAGLVVTNAQPEKLQITVPSTQASVVGTGAMPAVTVGSAYTSSTLTGTDSGAGRSYADVNTVSDTGTYVKVADASGKDVTNQMNVNLSANGEVLNLQSNGGVVDSSLTGSYNVYVHVMNDANSASSNCADVTCSTLTGGTPYTVFVNVPATLTGDVAIGPVDINAPYTYDFVSAGTLTVGNNPLVPASSSVVITLAGDATNTPLTDTGITNTITASDVVLGGAPAAKYGNETLNVTLNLVDAAGLVVTNAQPEKLQITVPSTQASVVGTGAMPAVNEDSAYTSSTLTGTTSGAGRSYADVNTVSDTGTYVKVADASGKDVTNKMNVNLAANGEVLNLQSNGGVVNSGLSGSYNVYVHVMNDANSASSNCADVTCSTLTGGTPYTVFVNTPSTLTGDVAIGPVDINAPYTYDFVSAGTLTVGNTPLVPASSSVVITLAGDATNTPLTDTGITNTITSSDVVLGGAPAAKYGNETLNVTLNLVDAAGLVVTNAQPEKLQITVPSTQASVVGTGAMPAVNEDSAYTSSTLTGTTSGAGRSYADVNTVSDTGTYVKVADASGKDVTNKMNVNLAANGEVLNLQSNGGVVNSGLSGSYNVYVHVMNDANSASSNCADVACSTLTGGTPYTVFVNTPPAIVPSANISTDATGPATIGVAYNYDFVAQGTLKLGASTSGSTDLTTSTLTMTLADGKTPVDPAVLGLTPKYSATDVVLAGTPIASEAGTYKVFLTVTDESGFVVDNTTAPATLTIVAPAPVVTSGDFSYHPSIGDTFTYTFANSTATANGGPVVSAGAGEYFDEAATTFIVTGTDGDDQTSLFELVYSNSGNTAKNGKSATGTNNVVTLQSKAPLSASDTFTVKFNVQNVDGQTKTGSTGSVSVGAVTGYLTCPDASQIGNNPLTVTTTTSSLMSASTGGTVLMTPVNFARTLTTGFTGVQLYGALLKVSGNKTTLTCNYMAPLNTSMDYVSTTTITTVDADGVQGVKGTGWSSSTQCNVGANKPTATSCQVYYTYEG